MSGGIPADCTALVSQTPGNSFPPGTTFGFGLEQQTLQGLNSAMDPTGAGTISDTNTLTELGSAFMLNDIGNGQVDNNATTQNTSYNACLNAANTLLSTGTESHACAEYIAWKNASAASADDDGPPDWSFTGFPTLPSPNPAEHDYSLKFVNCRDVPNFPSMSPPSDMNGGGT